MGVLKIRATAGKLLKTPHKDGAMDNFSDPQHTISVFDPFLYLAFELNKVHWKPGFTAI